MKNKSKASSNYDVKYYFLDLEFNGQDIFTSGTARVNFILTDISNPTVVLDLDDAMNVSDLRLDGSLITHNHNNNALSFTIPNPDTTSLYSVEIDYSGNPPYGMFHGTSAGFETTFSLSEPYSAMGWFPVKQDLADKADSSSVFITVPDNLMAGSNGLLTDTTHVPSGKVRYEWKSSYPIVYYLISIAVGDYMDYSIYAHPQGTSDSVLIQNYVYNNPSYLQLNLSKINETADLMEEFSDKFGVYPHHQEKYGHAMFSFNGGMEHQTMTSIGNFDFNLVAHELGHSWFGNSVTCASWQDIWINEGFAVYSEYIAHQALRPQSEADLWVQLTMYNAKLSNDGSVYVPFSELDDVNRIFNTELTYKKGGLLLHMIRYLLDDDALFFDVLQEHLDVYKDSVATGDDFKTVLESESGMSFDNFFNQWYYGEGYPIYDVEWYQNNDTIYLTNMQSASASQSPLFTIPLEYKFYFENGDSTKIQLNHDNAVETYKIPESRIVSSVELDPDNWVICDKTVANVGVYVEQQELKANIFPNPSDDGNFKINLPSEGKYDFEVYSLNGELLYADKIFERNYLLNLSDFSDGIYFLKIISEKGRYISEKLILRR